MAAFNMIIDPYDVWHVYQSVGINQWKYKSEDKERFIKPLQLSELQPNTIFIGNSCALDALDSETYEMIFGKKAYNMAVPAITLYEIKRYIEHAIATDDSFEEVILCIDFEMFIENKDHPLKRYGLLGFDEMQLCRRHMTGNNLAITLLSWQTFKDSLLTFKINNKYHIKENYYVKGRYGETALDYRNHHMDFKFYSSLYTRMRYENNYEDAKLSEEAFSEFQDIINTCQQNNIKLKTIILPVNARLMEARMICWDKFEAWRKRIVTMTSPIVSFDLYNEKTMTYKNNRVERDTDMYFWEVIHPKKSYGDLIFAFLAGRFYDQNFGMYITIHNVDENLLMLRNGREQWAKLHPKSLDEIRYCSAFYEQMPIAISDYMLSDYDNRFPIELSKSSFKFHFKQSDMLDLSGVRQWIIKDEYAIYGCLKRKDGKTYYALAESQETKTSMDSVGMMGFLFDHCHDMRGVHLDASLKNVEMGEYDVYIIEIDSEGNIYKSDVLQRITVDE